MQLSGVATMLILLLCANFADADSNAIHLAQQTVEQNLRTPLGQKYADSAESFYSKTDTTTVRSCLDSVPKPDTAKVEALVMLSRRGRVKNVVVNPKTNLSDCLARGLLEDYFPPPPGPNYWIRLGIKLP